MTKSAVIRAMVESDLKQDVENIFKTIGITTTEAITLFYIMVRQKKGIPFSVILPNPKTQRVIEDSRQGINTSTHDNIDDYFNKIEMEMNA